jgi:predicted nuclease of predicted toxin-antitoxin system
MAQGAPDSRVLNSAFRKKAVLIPYDKDFGEIVFMPSFGVLLVRLSAIRSASRAAIVGDTINLHGKLLEGRFAVLSEGGLRIRSI